MMGFLKDSADLVVEDKVIMELKVGRNSGAGAQETTSVNLSISDKELGLLVNFGTAFVKDVRIAKGMET